MNFKLVVTSLIATASAQTIADILSRDTTGVALIWDSIKTLPSSAMFSAKGNMTVFAPNNAAMTSLNGTYPTLYAAVTANPSDLDAIVKYHVIDAYLPVTADGVSILNTYSNMTSIWKNSAGKITVTGGIDRTATVIKYFEATNGIVYIVDTVLIPPLSLSITAQIMGWNGMTGVVEGAKLDGVLDTLKNKTYFVPTNDAVTKLLAQVSNAGYTLAASTLSVIVGEHIIKGAYHEEELSKVAQDPVGTITSSIGEKVIPYIKDDMTYLKGESTAGLPTAKIVSKEILLANGCVAYSVDQAIIPSNAILVKSLSATTPTIPK